MLEELSHGLLDAKARWELDDLILPTANHPVLQESHHNTGGNR